MDTPLTRAHRDGPGGWLEAADAISEELRSRHQIKVEVIIEPGSAGPDELNGRPYVDTIVGGEILVSRGATAADAAPTMAAILARELAEAELDPSRDLACALVVERNTNAQDQEVGADLHVYGEPAHPVAATATVDVAEGSAERSGHFGPAGPGSAEEILFG